MWISHRIFATAVFLVSPAIAAQDGLRAPTIDPTVEAAEPSRALSAGVYAPFPQSRIATGFLNEVNDEEFLHWVIHTPEVLPFRWSTEWDEAEEGMWRLRGPVLRSGSGVLATGIVSGTYNFSIDLSKYLPAEPPESPIVYKVDIIARTKAKTASAGATSASSPSTKVPAKELGAWSVPVLITYGKDTAEPTRFDIAETYQKVDFVLDRISADDLQSEVGTEEYRIAGFIQELFRSCHNEASLDCGYHIPGFHQQFGPFGKKLSPNKKTAQFGEVYRHPDKGFIPEKNRWTFDVKSQSGYPIARRLVVTTSVLEVDNGGKLNDWTNAIYGFEKAIYLDKILEFSKSELEEYLESNAGEIFYIVSDAVESFIASASESVGQIPVVGQIVIIVGFVVKNIASSIPDDYCGAGTHAMTLPTLNSADVHKLKGTTKGAGADRRFITERYRIRYECPPNPNSATQAPDGYGDIVFHWEFHEPKTP